MFDKGMLADGEGREIDFKNTVLFLTSNLASDIIGQLCSSTDRPDPQTLIEAIRPVLSRHFKPALLARMTVVPYYLLDSSFMKEIVTLRLAKLATRLQESNRIQLSYSGGVVDRIAERCTEVETGARNIEHIMRGTILPQLSTEILARMGEKETPSTVRLGVAKDGGFSVRLSD
jgi:type VI secretion system protein VasG